VNGQPPSLCGNCGSSLAERQRWCLVCGATMLTALGSPRHWASAGVAATIVALLALVGIGYAIATLVSS
jgi:predicted amidophosphoribosyltransferase